MTWLGLFKKIRAQGDRAKFSHGQVVGLKAKEKQQGHCVGRWHHGTLEGSETGEMAKTFL